MEIKAAVVIASDTRFAHTREDLSGPAAREALVALGLTVVEVVVVPDDEEPLAQAIRRLVERGDLRLIVTSGGTGLGPRDVTPEATRRVIDRDAPGIPEFLRAASLKLTPRAALSRAVAGVANRTLIINLPGSPKAVRESITFLAPILPHALETVWGETSECGR